VEINQDIETLTDTCRITIPRRLEWDGKKIAIDDDPILQRGDKVIVKLGYDGKLKTRFIGYVKDIKAGVPVTIECEDSMYLLKKELITKSYKSVTVRQLIEDIIPKGIEKVVYGDNEINIGQWRISKASIANVLDELKSKYNIYSYFRNITESGVTKPILYIGWGWWTDHRKEEIFEFSWNIIDSDLTYKRKEDIKLKAKAIAWQRNNTKIEVEVGDEDGEQRTLHFYNLDKTELERRAKVKLELLKYTGYRGSFTTFGEPALDKGDVANIIGNQYHPDGKYLVKNIRILSGVSGYRQIITPDSIINDKRASTSTAA
jgi:hypothetical protein